MQVLTVIHIATGLTGILCGLVVVAGILIRKPAPRFQVVFLATTLAAAFSGFCFFPLDGMTSAQVVGVFTTILLGLAIYAYYIQQLAGTWRQLYIMAAVEALFLNVLIAIAQSFQHIRFLMKIAPSQGSAVYIIVKATALLSFLVVGFFAVKRGRG